MMPQSSDSPSANSSNLPSAHADDALPIGEPSIFFQLLSMSISETPTQKDTPAVGMSVPGSVEPESTFDVT